ncbi:MAG: alpha-xylosidase [Bacteroidales bacterium]|nr:alpha-xylosidase [Bacteroidales bacterium]
MKKLRLFAALIFVAAFNVTVNAQLQGFNIVNEPVDISKDFADFQNTYYVASGLTDFDPASATGKIVYRRYEYSTRMAFNNMLGALREVEQNEFPANEYEASPTLPFALEFISDRTVRIKAKSGFDRYDDERSLMLVDGTVEPADPWQYSIKDNVHIYSGSEGRIEIQEAPFQICVYDGNNRLLTSTNTMQENSGTYTPVLPFSFVRRASDYSRSFNAAFNLSPGEKIFGLGESFTQFNKRGSKVVLFTDDANGTQNETMYKPVPFFMSSRGYGVFMHTSTPITCDFGKYYSGVSSLMIGDEELDLFLFLGDPKDILDEYTNITGKSPVPPLWSFGFWMSRITYFSEAEGREVVSLLRKHKVPSDVLHFDTGWFGVDWQCDYTFAPDRFDDPEKMLSDFRDQGIRTCLWQLPYFVPNNKLFDEIIEQDLYVKNDKGNLPREDAVLDFTNPLAVDWYQNKIKGLLDLGVSVIKVDFGEAAPFNGLYSNGRTGFYEHNLYPLRYNKAVSDITKEITGERIIWARSTWAGSQRYPMHWGGDPANTYSAMSATLRAGLSIGLTGFSFWSHDIGGFVSRTPENIYRHWTPFGMLTSHVRSHGHPPTEPWEYGEDFLNAFREATNMRYELMPYIYAQAHDCSEKGLPMLRALFVEFPGDPGSWLIDNQYMFGSDMLVAPLFSDELSRDVYLPSGTWIDYQTGTAYNGGWHHIESGEVPIVALVRAGSVIPHIKLAQSTAFMDWSRITLDVFEDENGNADGLVVIPGGELHSIEVTGTEGKYELKENPFGKTVKFKFKK